MNSKDNREAVTAARNRILGVHGQKRLVAWMEEKIREPTLDTEHSIMPLLNLTDKEAHTVTRYLLASRKKPAAAKK